MPADPCPTCAGVGNVPGDRPASPADVNTDGLVLHNTFGRTEREAAAWLIVRLLQVRGQGWGASFVMGDFAWLLHNDEPARQRCSNPFWRPDFGWLVDNWFVRQTNPDTAQQPCFVTDNFIDRLRRRVDCPTCCWRLSDLTDQGLGRGLVLLHPRAVVTWWRSLDAYAVTGPTRRTEAGIDPADLPTVLAAHGCRMPSDAALAWVRGGDRAR